MIAIVFHNPTEVNDTSAVEYFSFSVSFLYKSHTKRQISRERKFRLNQIICLRIEHMWNFLRWREYVAVRKRMCVSERARAHTHMWVCF